MAFVRREGLALLDRTGEPTVFRGVGIGNWLLPEGYMWRFFGDRSAPRDLEAIVAETAGDDYAATYWTRFRDAFFTEDDVARIAECGFDHVRLPLNSRYLVDEQGNWLEEGFGRIDDCLRWCRDHDLLVLLDLHGAPGGQTGTNIDDSPNRLPELFTDPDHQQACIALWQELARRYGSDEYVMGYDLLNEPLPNEYQHTLVDELRDLYRRLTAAIREVDPDHLIMYEGSHWASNLDALDAVWDENSCIHFHKYWSPTTEADFEPYLSAQRRLGLPLYMGESGENTPEWVEGMFGRCEQFEISWCFWPWKKLATETSMADAQAPGGWDEMVAYAEGKGEAPGRERAIAMWEAVLTNVAIERCNWRQEIVDALFAGRDGRWRP